MSQVLHIKVFRAGVGRMGFHAVLGDETVDHDDGGEHDGAHSDTVKGAVDRLMTRVERDMLLFAWNQLVPAKKRTDYKIKIRRKRK